MDGQQIAKRLFDAAVERARNQKVRLGNGADNDIRALSRKAASEIIRHSEATNSSIEAMVRSSERIFENLIDEMLFSRSKIPGYQNSYPGVIGEQTLALALRELCPMWPIC